MIIVPRPPEMPRNYCAGCQRDLPLQEVACSTATANELRAFMVIPHDPICRPHLNEIK